MRKPIANLITHDRSKREYTLEIEGEAWAFPAGHKPQAIQAAISMLYPHWYALAQAIVQAHPHLESRVWTAVSSPFHLSQRSSYQPTTSPYPYHHSTNHQKTSTTNHPPLH